MQTFTHRPPRLLLIALLLLAIVGCGGQTGQSQPRKLTIGVVTLVDLSSVYDGFKQGMTDLGYVEGQNVTYIYDGPTGTPDKLGPAVQKLVDAKVDLIFSMTTPATLKVKELTAANPIPVVFAPLTDPVGAGIVASLAAPGGNLTGVTTAGSEGRRLEWFHRIAPNVKRPLLPYNPNDPAVASAFRVMSEAAPKLDLELIPLPIATPEEVDQLLANFPADADGLILLADSLLTAKADQFVVITNERKLPFTVTNTIDQGALMAFGARFNAVGVQSARLADKILKGAKPADIPVETAEFFLQINLKTANAIGVPISDDVLRQAVVVVR